MGRTARARVAGALVLIVAASGARQAMAQPIPPADGEPPETTAPPPPPDDGWDPGEPPEAQNVPPPPPEAEPPAQAPTQSAFQNQLSPYGRWVQTPDYGLVWIPKGVPPDWQPYSDGRWVETQWGWSFASAVPWGTIVFHYGRWGFRGGLGWFWVPGYVWAPAWVSWRYQAGYVCWSPYGPAGFLYPRAWPGWVVVSSRAFTRPIRTHRVPWPHAAPVVRVARPAPSVVSRPVHGAFYGPPREFVRREGARPAPTARGGSRRR